jgi:hypothetical protein
MSLLVGLPEIWWTSQELSPAVIIIIIIITITMLSTLTYHLGDEQ